MIFTKEDYINDTKLKKLKTYLSDYRFEHSLGVMETAEKLAYIHGADVDKAAVAGLYHDVGKEVPKEQGLKILKEEGINITDQIEKDYSIYHGLIGRSIAKNDFNIYDRDVLSAIENHVLLKVNPSKLDKIVYLADGVEPSRDFDGIDEIRELAKNDLDRGVIASIDATLLHLIESGKSINTQTVDSRNYLIENLD